MSEPALDPRVFEEMRELMDDALGSFVATYLSNSPKLISQIEQAMAAGDAASIMHNAHQLKGGSGSIGALHLSELAQRMEQGARNGVLEGMPLLLADLKQEFERVDAALAPHRG